MNEEEQIKYYKKLYETETNPKIKEMLEHLIGMKERDISPGKPEELPDDQVHSPPDVFGVASQKEGNKLPPMFNPPASQLDTSPYTQTPTNKNIASALKDEGEYETKGDNLKKGASADNPIDSKTLAYEAQAQLPIGTWVTTAKGPHRINQGDKNWAKQMMQKQSTAKSKPMTEQSSQEDDVQAELEGAPRVFAEDSNNWDIRKKNFMGNVAVTNVSLIPQNVQTYGDLLQLKVDYEKAYNEARNNMVNHQDADAYAKRKVGMNCIGDGGSVIDEVIRNAQNAMNSERKKSSKAAAKTEKAAQKQIYESSPEGKAAAQKAREDAAARAAERSERVERNADRQ